MTERLQEYCDSRGVRMRVDRGEGVIRGVKILGLESRTGAAICPRCSPRPLGFTRTPRLT